MHLTHQDRIAIASLVSAARFLQSDIKNGRPALLQQPLKKQFFERLENLPDYIRPLVLDKVSPTDTLPILLSRIIQSGLAVSAKRFVCSHGVLAEPISLGR